MKTIYKILNGDKHWQVSYETQQEWLEWKALADQNGWYGEGYIVVEEPFVFLIAEVRSKRNGLLQETDKYFLYGSAAPLPEGVVKDDLKAYRDALRNITENLDLTGIKSIDEVEFPESPL